MQIRDALSCSCIRQNLLRSTISLGWGLYWRGFMVLFLGRDKIFLYSAQRLGRHRPHCTLPFNGQRGPFIRYFGLSHEFHNTCISSDKVRVSGVTRQIANFFVACRETDLTYFTYWGCHTQYVPFLAWMHVNVHYYNENYKNNKYNLHFKITWLTCE